VRVVHNVKQAKTIEDIGINVPRIYAIVENKQEEFQSHVVEAKSKIKNQPISILIDSGDSHSYLATKMV
jgi:hypothetical protein